jgi:hypothetical protein
MSELSELRRSWAPPPELAGMGPREVRLTTTGKVLTGVAVFMFLSAIAAYLGLSRLEQRQTAEREALRSTSIETRAIVTRHWHTGDKGDEARIAYTFEYEGTTYHGSSAAPQRIWRSLDVGSPITVRFVPARPELNHPSEWERDVMPAWLPGAATGWLAFIGLLLVFLIRRQSRLLSDGRAAPARVTGHRRVKNGHVVKYEFALPEGGTLKGSGQTRRSPPGVGSTICIVYDPDKPKRNRSYPMDLVRVER